MKSFFTLAILLSFQAKFVLALTKEDYKNTLNRGINGEIEERIDDFREKALNVHLLFTKESYQKKFFSSDSGYINIMFSPAVRKQQNENLATSKKKRLEKKFFNVNEGKLAFTTNIEGIFVKIENAIRAKKGEESFFYAFAKYQGSLKTIENKKYDLIFSPRMEKYDLTNSYGQYTLLVNEDAHLFSENDDETEKFLLYALKKATKGNEDVKSKTKDYLKRMFSQAIEYVCKVDFGDIRFRNLPFTKDGRLAAIDIDSRTADEGIKTLLDSYFVLGFFGGALGEQEVIQLFGLVKKACSKKNYLGLLDLLKIDRKKFELLIAQNALSDSLKGLIKTNYKKMMKKIDDLNI